MSGSGLSSSPFPFPSMRGVLTGTTIEGGAIERNSQQGRGLCEKIPSMGVFVKSFLPWRELGEDFPSMEGFIKSLDRLRGLEELQLKDGIAKGPP